jgi:arylsulfatase A-like enzyme
VIEHDRHIYCGMAQALDDGVGQITTLLSKRGLADNTVIFLTADNGGQNGVGGNNWPLRGNKATVFEGGVRGNGFVWGGRATQLYSPSVLPR